MPTAKITIELLADMAHRGRKWEIIEVSSSEARNMLIPKWLAREVTADRLKKIASDKKRAQDKACERLENAFEIKKKLDGQSLTFTLKGKNGKIFGGLDEHAIGTRVNENFGTAFENNDIKHPSKLHIKTAGTHLVYLHITKDTMAKIVVEVNVEDK